jgi:AcrR family transcriptional regulator
MNVKGRRRYDASRRRVQAGRTRADILAAARRRFLADGYPATTIAAIAADSGASVETIYKSIGGKARLVKAVFDVALAGDAPEPMDTVGQQVSTSEPDAKARLRSFGSLVADIGPRVAPLALLVRDAAATDRELAQVWDELNAERLARMTVHAQRLYDDGLLRPEITVQEARDVLWAFCSPEVYDLFVQRQEWTTSRFGQWVGEAYIAALLPPNETRPHPKRRRR